MKNKLLLTFLLVALLQLAVPIKMILDKEKIISAGTEYKFRTAPVDPYDPFRGKYITLSFDANTYYGENDNYWHTNDIVYVLLGIDSAGFAKITSITKQQPLNAKPDYVKAKIQYAYDKQVNIEYSFNQFYMEEYKAPNAEKVYREANRRGNDTTQIAYALVSVKEGDAVIKDVIINGASVIEISGKK